MTVKKTKPKQLLRPITTGADSVMIASHWLKNWYQSFKPITKHSNRNHLITFDSHLKTALLQKSSNSHWFLKPSVEFEPKFPYRDKNCFEMIWVKQILTRHLINCIFASYNLTWIITKIIIIMLSWYSIVPDMVF